MRKVLVNKLGKIDISLDVISTIAGHTAMECYGLACMAAKKVREGLAQLLGHSSLDRGVEIQQTGEGKVIINLYVIIDYGAKVSEVSENIMRRVKYEVESSTGILVEKVNVSIQGVRNARDM